jgi:F0F1-type ATP synthase membrane subunit b/b'
MSKASEYRRQAQELREAATTTRDRITRKTLLKLAEEFDRMAEYPIQNHPKQMPRLTDP